MTDLTTYSVVNKKKDKIYYRLFRKYYFWTKSESKALKVAEHHLYILLSRTIVLSITKLTTTYGRNAHQLLQRQLAAPHNCLQKTVKITTILIWMCFLSLRIKRLQKSSIYHNRRRFSKTITAFIPVNPRGRFRPLVLFYRIYKKLLLQKIRRQIYKLTDSITIKKVRHPRSIYLRANHQLKISYLRSENGWRSKNKPFRNKKCNKFNKS